jgi:No apical meristem (NAM) protein
MGLREIEQTLPPGFRFFPSDEELVCYYLYKKVANERILEGILVEVDLHQKEPWELPGALLILILNSLLIHIISAGWLDFS